MKTNEIISITRYCIVDSVQADNKINVKDLNDGQKFQIFGDDLVEGLASADSFDSTQRVTKTEIAEKLISAEALPFTVEFRKADNTKRVLRGRLLGAEPLMGRSYVEDFDITAGNRLRQVDHRTIQSLIIGKVKYDARN